MSGVQDTALSDGSTVYRNSIQQDGTAPVLLICFHGSGEHAAEAWNPLLDILEERGHHVVLFDRPQTVINESGHAALVADFLQSHVANCRYIVLAHSYGGLFAKRFALARPNSIAGIVLVETGKAREPEFDKTAQRAARKLLSTPLVVISGNSMLAQRTRLEANGGSDAQWQQLKHAEAHDRTLEAHQLRVSRRHKHIKLSGCGHHIIRDRPDAVLEALDWVMAEMASNSPIKEQSNHSTDKSSWFNWPLLRSFLRSYRPRTRSSLAHARDLWGE